MDQDIKQQGQGSESEDIDQILLQEDPSFQKEMSEIGEGLSDAEVSDLSAEETELDLSEDQKKPELELKEDAPTLIKKFRLKVVLPIKNFKDRILFRIDYTFRRSKIALFVFAEKTKIFVLQSLPDFFRYLRSQAKIIAGKTVQIFKRFMTLSLGQRLALISATALLVAAVFFLSLTFESRWLANLFPALPTSLKSVGVEIGGVDSRSQALEFSTAFPDYEYQVKLKRVVVNLRRDAYSGSLPMGAFEFYIGLDSQDTAIEIKDREKEVLDRIQRELEQLTYTEVMSSTGKLKMKSRIRESINEMLNQGRVIGVYINTMVTNH